MFEPDMPHLLSQLDALPEIRQDRVEQARERIAEGYYDDDTELSIALDRMLGEL
jgi:anti-sigma28 factor (negative regulator of flagellin synthesis)